LSDKLSREYRLILLTFFTVSFVLPHVCACYSHHLFAQDNKPDDGYWILERCLKSQIALNHVSMRISTDVRLDAVAVDDRPRHQGCDFWFRRDAHRLSMIGDIILFDGKTDAPKLQPFRSVINEDGWVLSNNAQGKSGIVSDRVDYQIARHLQNLLDGGALNGYFPGDDGKRLTEWMLDTKNVRVDGQEVVNGVACKVILAAGPFGKIREWIAPDRDYLPLKVAIHKGLQDIDYAGKTIAEHPKESRFAGQSLVAYSLILENIELLKIGEAYVAVAGRATETEHMSKKHDIVTVFTYKCSDVDLKPDFEGTDFFTPGLVKDAIVSNSDNSTSGVQYKWDGKKAVKAGGDFFAEPGGFSLSRAGTVRVILLVVSILVLLALTAVFFLRKALRS
jgi:hypothetical protein